MKDELEKLFHKYLRAQQPRDADWNSPSDEVWLGVEKALNNGRSQRRPFLLLWLAIGLLFLGLLFVLYHVNSLHTEKTDSSGNEAVAVSPMQQPLEKPLRKRLLSEEKQAQTTLPNSALPPANEKPRRGFAAKSGKPKSKLKNANRAAHTLQMDSPSAKNTQTANPAVEHIEAGLLQPLAWCKAPELLSNERRSLEVLTAFPEPASKEKRNIRPFFLFVYAGLSETFSPMKGKMSDGFEAMVKSNKAMPSFHLAAEVGWKLGNNWGFTSGVHYRSVKLWSLSQIQTQFDASAEEPDASGFMRSSQQFFIPSSVNMMDKQISLRYPSSLGLQTGDLLEAEVEVVNELQLFRFPVGLFYERILHDKLSVLASAGMSWNAVLKSEAHLTPAVKYQTYSMQVESPNKVKTFFPNYWDVFGHISAFYRISPSCNLGLRLAYYWELKPHFQLNDMRSRLSSLDFSTGIFYRF